MKLTIIIDDDDMTPEEREEFVDQVRGLVHNEWWSQFSGTVVGPCSDDLEKD